VSSNKNIQLILTVSESAQRLWIDNLTTMSSYQFELEMSVRDYELDTQGVVNNSVYQNYLEHARHEYLKYIGVNFNDFHRDGLDAVVHKVELTYKKPLKGDDRFVVRINARPKGNVRFVFYQDIYRLPDHELILTGVVTAVFMTDDRPVRPPENIMQAMARFSAS